MFISVGKESYDAEMPMPSTRPGQISGPRRLHPDDSILEIFYRRHIMMMQQNTLGVEEHCSQIPGTTPLDDDESAHSISGHLDDTEEGPPTPGSQIKFLSGEGSAVLPDEEPKEKEIVEEMLAAVMEGDKEELLEGNSVIEGNSRCDSPVVVIHTKKNNVAHLQTSDNTLLTSQDSSFSNDICRQYSDDFDPEGDDAIDTDIDISPTTAVVAPPHAEQEPQEGSLPQQEMLTMAELARAPDVNPAPTASTASQPQEPASSTTLMGSTSGSGTKVPSANYAHFGGTMTEPQLSPDALFLKAIAQLEYDEALHRSIAHVTELDAARQAAEAERENVLMTNLVRTARAKEQDALMELALARKQGEEEELAAACVKGLHHNQFAAKEDVKKGVTRQHIAVRDDSDDDAVAAAVTKTMQSKKGGDTSMQQQGEEDETVAEMTPARIAADVAIEINESVTSQLREIAARQQQEASSTRGDDTHHHTDISVGSVIDTVGDQSSSVASASLVMGAFDHDHDANRGMNYITKQYYNDDQVVESEIEDPFADDVGAVIPPSPDQKSGTSLIDQNSTTRDPYDHTIR